MSEKEFHELELNDDIYKVEYKREYKGKKIKQEDILTCFHFAYDMTFGGKGEHRRNRSGGKEERSECKIFRDAFQGKLAEYCFYNYYKNLFPENYISKPDISCSDIGTWDYCDFETKKNGIEKKVAVKSTKFYSDLLLLETKDWDKNGLYLHTDNENKIETIKYDGVVLVRVKNNIGDYLKNNKLLDLDECDISKLLPILNDSKYWSFDIAGFINYHELVFIINQNHIIKQNYYLNKKDDAHKIDAENYYVQADDLHKL